MTQEEKNLLQRDLCGRLPYGIKAAFFDIEDECENFDVVEYIDVSNKECKIGIGQYCLSIDKIKPYLFPLSSMTEEQKYICPIGVGNLETFIEKESWAYLELSFDSILRFIDWLNKNHFDYRGLIDKSLALDATNLGIYE